MTTNYDIVGWLPLASNGYVNLGGRRRFKMYSSYNMAKQHSPIDKAVPVHIEEEFLNEMHKGLIK